MLFTLFIPLGQFPSVTSLIFEQLINSHYVFINFSLVALSFWFWWKARNISIKNLGFIWLSTFRGKENDKVTKDWIIWQMALKKVASNEFKDTCLNKIKFKVILRKVVFTLRISLFFFVNLQNLFNTIKPCFKSNIIYFIISLYFSKSY